MEIADILKSGNINPREYTKSGSVGNTKFDHMLAKNMDNNDSKMDFNSSGTKIDKKLMDTCIEMESIFVSKMLKEMRETLPKEKLLDGGFAEKIFEDMLYDEYSLNMSRTANLGLAKMLYEELSRK